MLRKEICLNSRKGMGIGLIVSFAIALFIVLIILIVTLQKYGIFDKFGDKCEPNGGRCVTQDKCGSCNEPDECTMRFYTCEQPKNSNNLPGTRLICCPASDVI